MWLPSTSASVIIIILWYLILVISNLPSILFCSLSSIGFPTPPPIAVISAPISLLVRTCLSFALSTFRIFPLKGSIAWFFLSLPCFADPPAESPSTINNSESSGFFSWQSASLPGRDVFSKPVFLLVNSLAFLAASLAFEASIILSITLFISEDLLK